MSDIDDHADTAMAGPRAIDPELLADFAEMDAPEPAEPVPERFVQENAIAEVMNAIPEADSAVFEDAREDQIQVDAVNAILDEIPVVEDENQDGSEGSLHEAEAEPTCCICTRGRCLGCLKEFWTPMGKIVLAIWLGVMGVIAVMEHTGCDKALSLAVVFNISASILGCWAIVELVLKHCTNQDKPLEEFDGPQYDDLHLPYPKDGAPDPVVEKVMETFRLLEENHDDAPEPAVNADPDSDPENPSEDAASVPEAPAGVEQFGADDFSDIL